MAPVELPVVDRAERGHEPPAAAVDGKDLVTGAVGDEDGGAPGRGERREEAGRKGRHVGEAVAVGQAKGQRGGGPIGEAGERDAGRVGRDGDEGEGQRRSTCCAVRLVPASSLW